MQTPDERIVYVDLETAGLDPSCSILQIGAVAVDSEQREIGSFEAKLRCDMRRIRPEHRRKCWAYRREHSRELLRPHQAAKRFAEFLSRHATLDMPCDNRPVRRVAQLAAHNAAHERQFLVALFNRTRQFLPAHPRILCTIQRATWLFAENKTLTPPPDYRLATLCKYFGIPLAESEAHDALVDARATAALYRAMLGWPCKSPSSRDV